MIAYGYDLDGYYTVEKQCQLDPIESQTTGTDVWLLPANSTFEKPPEEQEGYRRKWTGEEWIQEEIPQPEPPPEPTEDELKEQVRLVRNSYLSYWDFTQLDDAPFTEDEKSKYREYRQYLRDYTNEDNWWLQNPDDWATWLLVHYPVTEE